MFKYSMYESKGDALTEGKMQILELMESIRREKTDGEDTEDLDEELEAKMDQFLRMPHEDWLAAVKEEISELLDAIIIRKADGEDYTELAQELKQRVKEYISVSEQVNTGGNSQLVMNVMKSVLGEF